MKACDFTSGLSRLNLKSWLVECDGTCKERLRLKICCRASLRVTSYSCNHLLDVDPMEAEVVVIRMRKGIPWRSGAFCGSRWTRPSLHPTTRIQLCHPQPKEYGCQHFSYTGSKNYIDGGNVEGEHMILVVSYRNKRWTEGNPQDSQDGMDAPVKQPLRY